MMPHPSAMLLALALTLSLPLLAQTPPPTAAPAAPAAAADAAKAKPADEAPKVDPATLPAPDPKLEIKPDQLKTKEVKNSKGKLIRQYQYFVDQYGREVKHGPYVQYYDNGNKEREVTYDHGLPDGMQTWYYISGERWMQFNTVRGVRDGTYQEWAPDGRRLRLMVYQMGKVKPSK